MSPNEMKVGHFYRRCGFPTAEYLGMYEKAHLMRQTGGGGGLFSASLDDYIETDRAGNPIAPDPMVGDVWKLESGEEYRINLVHLPDGARRYVPFSNSCGSWTMDKEMKKSITGLTFVRRAGE